MGFQNDFPIWHKLTPAQQERILGSLIAYGGGQRPRLRSSAAAVRPNGHPNIDS